MSHAAITERQSRSVGLEGTFKGSCTTEGADRQRERRAEKGIKEPHLDPAQTSSAAEHQQLRGPP